MLHLRPLCCYQDANSDYLSIFLKTSIDSFAFDNSKIKSFRVKFENKRKLRNKLRLVYNELSSRLKNMGTGEKENSSAVVVPLSNGMRAFVSFEKVKGLNFLKMSSVTTGCTFPPLSMYMAIAVSVNSFIFILPIV